MNQVQQTYWYDIIKAASHDDLRVAINEAAAQGWEPIECYAALGTFGAGPRNIDHFCLLRRLATNSEGRQ